MKGEKRQELIKQAEKLMSRGKLEGALSRYRKVLKANPDDTNTLNRVGDVYARLNKVDDAIALYKKTAQHFSKEGFYVKSIAIYKKIVRLDPTLIDVLENLADLQQRQGLTREAISQFEVVADYYQKVKDFNSVVAIHKKIVSLEPGDPSRRLKLADLYLSKNRLQDALEQYRAISRMMLQHGRIGEASRVCLRALEIDPSDLKFIGGAIEELKTAGHPEEAETLLIAAIEKNPEARSLEAKLHAEPDTSSIAVDEELDEQEAQAISLLELEEEAEEKVEEKPQVTPAPAVEEAPEPEFAAPQQTAASAETEATPVPAKVGPTEASAEEIEIDIDLGDLLEEAVPSEVAPAPVARERLEPAPPRPPMTEPEPAEQIGELLTEADVLARYGLEDKAIEKLEELVAQESQHLEALRRLVTLHLEGRKFERVAELANQLLPVVRANNQSEIWDQVREQLIGEGFTMEGGQVMAPAEEAVLEVEDESLMIAEEVDQSGEIDLSWLEEAPAQEAPVAPASEALFEGEEEFFDLASELEEELRHEEDFDGDELLPPPEDQSIEEIVEGFKKGMSETLSDEDFDTHYNLGIAYREMGLVDEAIGEFQLAAKDGRYLVECCSLLAHCFQDKGFPELAVKWYRKGLESPTITEDETLGLVYELGDLYLATGNIDAARERFVEIYGINSNYRDVVAKLQELGGH